MPTEKQNSGEKLRKTHYLSPGGSIEGRGATGSTFTVTRDGDYIITKTSSPSLTTETERMELDKSSETVKDIATLKAAELIKGSEKFKSKVEEAIKTKESELKPSDIGRHKVEVSPGVISIIDIQKVSRTTKPTPVQQYTGSYEKTQKETGLSGAKQKLATERAKLETQIIRAEQEGKGTGLLKLKLAWLGMGAESIKSATLIKDVAIAGGQLVAPGGPAILFTKYMASRPSASSIKENIVSGARNLREELYQFGPKLKQEPSYFLGSAAYLMGEGMVAHGIRKSVLPTKTELAQKVASKGARKLETRGYAYKQIYTTKEVGGSVPGIMKANEKISLIEPYTFKVMQEDVPAFGKMTSKDFKGYIFPSGKSYSVQKVKYRLKEYDVFRVVKPEETTTVVKGSRMTKKLVSETPPSNIKLEETGQLKTRSVATIKPDSLKIMATGDQELTVLRGGKYAGSGIDSKTVQFSIETLPGQKAKVLTISPDYINLKEFPTMYQLTKKSKPQLDLIRLTNAKGVTVLNVPARKQITQTTKSKFEYIIEPKPTKSMGKKGQFLIPESDTVSLVKPASIIEREAAQDTKLFSAFVEETRPLILPKAYPVSEYNISVKPSTASKSKVLNITDIITESKTEIQPKVKASPKYDISVRRITDTSPKYETVTIPKIISKPVTAQKSVLDIFQEQKKVSASQSYRDIQYPRYPRQTPKPRTKFLLWPIPSQKHQQRTRGYLTLVRRRGSWFSLGRPRSKGAALDIGARAVSKTPAASFRLIPKGYVKKSGKGSFFRSIKQKLYKKEDLFYVEKSKFRINTLGELSGITMKGLQAQKNKRKRLKWL